MIFGGGKITSTQFFLIDKGILQWCAKGIVIIVNNFRCASVRNFCKHHIDNDGRMW